MIEDIKKRLEAATEGPWEALFAFGSSDLPVAIIKNNGKTKMVAGVEVSDDLYICEVHPDAKNPTPDFRFIANAPTDIKYLLEKLDLAVSALEKVSGAGRPQSLHRALVRIETFKKIADETLKQIRGEDEKS